MARFINSLAQNTPKKYRLAALWTLSMILLVVGTGWHFTAKSMSAPSETRAAAVIQPTPPDPPLLAQTVTTYPISENLIHCNSNTFLTGNQQSWAIIKGSFD